MPCPPPFSLERTYFMDGLYLQKLVLYLDSSTEQAIPGSSQIKKQHEATQILNDDFKKIYIISLHT